MDPERNHLHSNSHPRRSRYAIRKRPTVKKVTLSSRISHSRFQQLLKPPGPQSQSFSRSYGSNLPTSLTYIVLGLEAVHLGDLLRIWVRPAVKLTLTPSDFQGPTGVHRTAQDPRCFTEATSLSPDKPIPGITLLTKKRELFPELQPTFLSLFALPLWTPRRRSPQAGSGMLTRFPFALRV